MSMNERIVAAILENGEPRVEAELARDHGRGVGARFRAGAVQHIASLAADAPRFRNVMNHQLFGLAVPVVGMYRALRGEVGIEPEPALRLLEEMVRTTFIQLGESFFLRLLFAAPFRVAPLRRLALASAYAAHEEVGGFRFGKVDGEGALLAFDVHECAIVSYARAHGVPEVVPMICRLDELMAEHMSRLELRRNGTLATGAERCDFRYFPKRG